MTTTRTFERVFDTFKRHWCIVAHDLTKAECSLIENIITNNWCESRHYKARHSSGSSPFLQGFRLPYGTNDGWVLIEFWTRDEVAIDAMVAYVNKCFAEETAK